MATALGTLGLGVLRDALDLGPAINDPFRELGALAAPAFGVAKGESDDRAPPSTLKEVRDGEDGALREYSVRLGLERELNCLAVKPMYLEAREPEVI